MSLLTRTVTLAMVQLIIENQPQISAWVSNYIRYVDNYLSMFYIFCYIIIFDSYRILAKVFAFQTGHEIDF